jgi:hypothetical protein
LGPALRVEITATYEDDPAYEPEMRPALCPAIMANSRADFAIQPVRFAANPPSGVDETRFGFKGTCRDRLGGNHPVIVYWRTSHDGAYGAFDAATRAGRRMIGLRRCGRPWR